MNSLTKDSHGNYLISLRWMATLYYINGTSGEVIWRLSGKYSDFIMELDADFWFQHVGPILALQCFTLSLPYRMLVFWAMPCPRRSTSLSLVSRRARGVCTVLTRIASADNAAGSEVIEDTARGLILEVDTDKMTVTKAMEFLPSFAHTTFSQGGVDVSAWPTTG